MYIYIYMYVYIYIFIALLSCNSSWDHDLPLLTVDRLPGTLRIGWWMFSQGSFPMRSWQTSVRPCSLTFGTPRRMTSTGAPLLGLDMVGRLGWWGGQKMMPSIPLLSFKSRKGLIISHASLIPRYAKYFCNFLPTNLGSYLKWSHSFATFRLRHVGCRTQVRRCLTALEDSAVLVNAIDVIWRPLERRDAMAQGPEGCLPPPYWIFFSGCTR